MFKSIMEILPKFYHHLQPALASLRKNEDSSLLKAIAKLDSNLHLKPSTYLPPSSNIGIPRSPVTTASPSIPPSSTPLTISTNKNIFVFTGKQSYVKIHTGKDSDKATYEVPKNLICFYSPYFKAAFNGEFVEGQSQEMTMEDVESEIFGLLVAWVYTQKIWNGDTDKIGPVDLAKLWVLADRCLMPQLQNHAMKKLGNPCRFDNHDPKVPTTLENSPGFCDPCSLAERNSIIAKKELITYVNSIESSGTPLHRYCTCIVLCQIKDVAREIDNLKKGEKTGQLVTLHDITGSGILADAIKALVSQGIGWEFHMAYWNVKDFKVDDSS